MASSCSPVYVALVHHPVVNRKGELIASAITSLDLHDLARTACTYDIPTCYIVTPLKDQQSLAERLLKHWCEGIGRDLHPEREQALRRLRLVDSIRDARDEIAARCGQPPVVWATSAKTYEGAVAHDEARKRIAEEGNPFLLLFGTAWGLAPSVLRDETDGVLEAVRGLNGYNHLPVRCAAAILMDRLLGRDV